MAKIMSIKLSDDEEPVPVSAVVELSLAEILLIARITGRHSHNKAEEIMQGGGDASTKLYHGLVGNVINRFWDSGTDEAISDLVNGEVTGA